MFDMFISLRLTGIFSRELESTETWKRKEILAHTGLNLSVWLHSGTGRAGAVILCPLIERRPLLTGILGAARRLENACLPRSPPVDRKGAQCGEDNGPCEKHHCTAYHSSNFI